MNPSLVTLEIDATKASAFLRRVGSEFDLPFLRAFPHNSCEAASAIFAAVAAAKYSPARVKVARGYDRVRGESHFWVEVADFVVDLTADQFGEVQGPLTTLRPSPFEEKFSDVERLAPADAMKQFPRTTQEAYSAASTELEKALAA
jgi:hypothetical protein